MGLNDGYNIYYDTEVPMQKCNNAHLDFVLVLSAPSYNTQIIELNDVSCISILWVCRISMITFDTFLDFCEHKVPSHMAFQHDDTPYHDTIH